LRSVYRLPSKKAVCLVLFCGRRKTANFEKRRASGAGKPNGWLVAPTYYRGSRPSSPRPSSPLHFCFHETSGRETRGPSDDHGHDRSDEWRVTRETTSAILARH